MAEGAFPAAAVADAAAAAGAYLRVEADAVMARCADCALGVAEDFCGRTWIRRTHQAVIGAGTGWQRLARAPVAGITGAVGLPAEGAPFVLPVEAYGYDIDSGGVGWVRVLAPGAAGRVAISYVAGLGDWGDLPGPVATGVTLIAAHLFEHREAAAQPPAAVAALLRPYRQVRL